MQRKNQPAKSSLIIKFDGRRLDNRSIPIDDLANTLISVQRIINKAYLASIRDITGRTKIGKEIRDHVSLQLVSHDKGSDIYGLSPFITDPATQELLKELMVQVLASMSIYAAQAVIRKISGASKESLKSGKDEIKTIKSSQQTGSISEDPGFLSSIHSDIDHIASTVRRSSVVTSVQISISNNKNVAPVVFDKDIRQYTQALENEVTYGEYQEIEGQIINLIPETNTITIRKKHTKNKRVKAHFSQQDFEKIRKSDIKIVKLGGRPIFAFGKNVGGNKFDAFEVSKIISRE